MTWSEAHLGSERNPQALVDCMSSLQPNDLRQCHDGHHDQRPVVSVVIPTFNRPLQLHACLAALAEQTFSKPWEVVVVDDGSPQRADHITSEWSQRLDLRVIHQENLGPAAARNRGVKEAKGALIAFTDDDCRPEPQWLDLLMQATRQWPGALVGGNTVNGLRSEHFASTSQLIVDFVYAHFNKDPDHAYFFSSNNVLCPKASFLSLGGFDISFPRAGAEDRDFCDRWRSAGWPLIWRPQARVEHRHSQSLWRFINLHVRYGRGAYLYQAKRKRRHTGTMLDDLGFHRSSLRRIRCHLQAGNLRLIEKASLISALAIWQTANAFGFFFEAVSTSTKQLLLPPSVPSRK